MKPHPRLIFTFGLLAVSLLATSSSRAANVASDNAGNYTTSTYNSDPNHPINLGTGFGMWSLGASATGSRGTFLSTGNNGNSTNINTGGNAFDIFANGGGTLGVTRAFTADTVTNSANLAVGQTLSLSFNNLGIDNGQSVGISLGSRFTFMFVGGAQDYTYTDGSGTNDTLISYVNNGLTFAFTLTGTNTYQLVLNTLGDQQNNTITGTLAGTAGTGINSVTVFDNNAGNSNDLFFNSLAITGTPAGAPEPSTWAMLMLGVLVLLAAVPRLRAAGRD